MYVADLSGLSFGSLTVLTRGANDKTGHVTWVAKCECGNICNVKSANIKRAKSCGCSKRAQEVKAGVLRRSVMSPKEIALRGLWKGMISRTSNPKNLAYKYYGGRGIKVCDRWKVFENFLLDMGVKPDGLSLDRKDNDGDYCPENCKWSTSREQVINRRPFTKGPRQSNWKKKGVLNVL